MLLSKQNSVNIINTLTFLRTRSLTDENGKSKYLIPQFITHLIDIHFLESSLKNFKVLDVFVFQVGTEFDLYENGKMVYDL